MDAYLIIWGTSLILAAILLPGLAVTLAMFPRLNDIRWAERLGLSLVFGIIPELALYFLSNNLNVPITKTTSQTAVAAVTAIGIIVWRLRVQTLSERTCSAATAQS
jgi:hypothetical protein